MRDQRGIEAIETGRHRRVRGEVIPRARGCQRHGEGAVIVFHKAARALEHGQRGVSLVEVAHVGLRAQRSQQSPAADAEHYLLLETKRRSPSVQLGGNPPAGRRIRWIVAVQEVEPSAVDVNLPGAKPELLSR